MADTDSSSAIVKHHGRQAKEHKALVMTGLVTGSFAVGFNRGVIKLSLKALKMTGIITGLFAVGFNRRTSNAYIISGL